MSKRWFIKFVAVLALVASSGLTNTFANAAGTTSSTIIPAQSQVLEVIPVDDSASIVLWASFEPNAVNRLYAARLELDGSMGAPSVLDSGFNVTFWQARQPDIKHNYLKLPNGRMVVAWAKSDYGVDGEFDNSSISYATTLNGSEWSTKFNAITGFSCEIYGTWINAPCGFQNVEIALSHSKLVIFGDYRDLYTPNASPKVYVASSSDYTTWSTAEVFAPAQIPALSMNGLVTLANGDLLVTFRSTDLKYFATRQDSSDLWSVPVDLRQTGRTLLNLHEPLIQTGPNEYTQFIVNSNLRLTLSRYIASTGTWSLPEDPAPSLDNPCDYAEASANGSHVAVVCGSYVYEKTNGSWRSAEKLRHPGVSAKTMGVFVNADQSVSVVYADSAATFACLTLKNLTQTSMSSSSLTSDFAPLYSVSPSGNFFGVNSQGTKSYTFRNYAPPIPSRSVSIAGTAKVGKALSLSVPTFTSPVGVGVTKIAWYWCENPVNAAAVQLPQDCWKIRNASGSKLTISSLYKGSYLIAGVSNENSAGKTLLFSQSTSVVK